MTLNHMLTWTLILGMLLLTFCTFFALLIGYLDNRPEGKQFAKFAVMASIAPAIVVLGTLYIKTL